MTDPDTATAAETGASARQLLRANAMTRPKRMPEIRVPFDIFQNLSMTESLQRVWLQSMPVGTLYPGLSGGSVRMGPDICQPGCLVLGLEFLV